MGQMGVSDTGIRTCSMHDQSIEESTEKPAPWLTIKRKLAKIYLSLSIPTGCVLLLLVQGDGDEYDSLLFARRRLNLKTQQLVVRRMMNILGRFPSMTPWHKVKRSASDGVSSNLVCLLSFETDLAFLCSLQRKRELAVGKWRGETNTRHGSRVDPWGKQA